MLQQLCAAALQRAGNSSLPDTAAAAGDLSISPDMMMPILALTATCSTTDIQRCTDCGMSEYVLKPVKYQPLEAVLKRYLPIVKTRTARLSMLAAGAASASAVSMAAGAPQ